MIISLAPRSAGIGGDDTAGLRRRLSYQGRMYEYPRSCNSESMMTPDGTTFASLTSLISLFSAFM